MQEAFHKLVQDFGLKFGIDDLEVGADEELQLMFEDDFALTLSYQPEEHWVRIDIKVMDCLHESEERTAQIAGLLMKLNFLARTQNHAWASFTANEEVYITNHKNIDHLDPDLLADTIEFMLSQADNLKGTLQSFSSRSQEPTSPTGQETQPNPTVSGQQFIKA